MMLRAAYSKGSAVTTDDASLVEATGDGSDADDGGMISRLPGPRI